MNSNETKKTARVYDVYTGRFRNSDEANEQYIGIEKSSVDRFKSIIDKAVFEDAGFVQIGIPYRIIDVREAERFIRCRFRGYEVKLEEHDDYHTFKIANANGSNSLNVMFFDEERDMSLASKMLRRAYFALCDLLGRRSISSIWTDR